MRAIFSGTEALHHLTLIARFTRHRRHDADVHALGHESIGPY
jgi:hypothetical protein